MQFTVKVTVQASQVMCSDDTNKLTGIVFATNTTSMSREQDRISKSRHRKSMEELVCKLDSCFWLLNRFCKLWFFKSYKLYPLNISSQAANIHLTAVAPGVPICFSLYLQLVSHRTRIENCYRKLETNRMSIKKLYIEKKMWSTKP